MNAIGRHPLYQGADKLKAAFLQLSFQLADDGDNPEIEEAGVTFPTWEEPEEAFGWQKNPVLLTDCRTLLRTRLLPAQLRTLRQEPPIRLLTFGRAYCKGTAAPIRILMEGFVAEKGLTDDAWKEFWERFTGVLLGNRATTSFVSCDAGSYQIVLQDKAGKKYELGYTGPASDEAIKVCGVNVPAWVFVIDVEQFALQLFSLSDSTSLLENDIDFLNRFATDKIGRAHV